MKAKIGQNHALKDIVKISRYLLVSRYFLMFPNDAIYCFRDISRYKTLNPDPVHWMDGWMFTSVHGLGTLSKDCSLASFRPPSHHEKASGRVIPAKNPIQIVLAIIDSISKKKWV